MNNAISEDQKMSFKRFTLHRLVILFVLTALELPGLAQPAQAVGKILRISSREFPRFDPQLTGITSQASVENALFRGLLRYDEKGNPTPSIAADVPSVANGGISA